MYSGFSTWEKCGEHRVNKISYSFRLEMIIELSQDYRMNPQQVVSEPQFRRFKDSSETDQDRF
ncbi:hypothetical protein YC2023_017270 [Brassica napus]